MKIAVTGATGFIGRHVISALIDRGYDILVVGRSAPQAHHRLSFVEVDLLTEKNHKWIAKYQPSYLLHLAWYVEHGKFWISPLNLNWCDATVQLINAFVNQGGKRVVVAGSCAEYDWSFGYCQESKTPSNPSTLYGTAKDCARRMAEKICHLNNVSLAWARIFLPFGFGENEQRLIPSITRALLGACPPFVINIQQWRDILPVEVVADGLIFLINQTDSGIFNICSGQPTQLCDLIKNIANTLDKNPEILLLKGNSSSNENDFIIGDPTTLAQKGWQPTYDLWKSLNLYVNRIKNQH